MKHNTESMHIYVHKYIYLHAFQRFAKILDDSGFVNIRRLQLF